MASKVKELRMDNFSFKPTLSAPVKVGSSSRKIVDKQSIEMASAIIFKQMEIEGLRTKTLVSYKKALRLFVEFTDVEYVEDINMDNLLNWIYVDGLQANTRANRLR